MTVRVIDASGAVQVYQEAEATRLLPEGGLLVIADLGDDPTVGRVLAVYPPGGWRRHALEGSNSTVQLPEPQFLTGIIGEAEAGQPTNPEVSAAAGRSPFDSITLTYGELRQLIALHLHQAQLTMGRMAPWLDVEHQARAMSDGETPLRIGEVLGLPHPVLEPTQQREPRPATEEPLVLFDRDPESLSAAVHQAGGAFSVCWESMSGTGVFQDDRARAVAEQLIAWIEEHYSPRGMTVEQPPIPGTTAPELLSALRELGDHYGPLGVALAAARLTRPLSVIAALRSEETLTEHDATDAAEQQAEKLLARGLLTASADVARSAIGRAIRDASSRDDGTQRRSADVMRLAEWIASNVPGEPSRSEGAIDCAIRLLRTRHPSLPPALHDGDRVSLEDADGKGVGGTVASWHVSSHQQTAVVLIDL